MVEKFFRVPENASDGLKKVIADIKKQEDKNHFVSQLAAKYGLPAWNKSVTNTPVNNINARSATDDSLQLFLIPFRAADSSVSSYLMCASNGDDFTYRYYKKNIIAPLYVANDTIKQLREGLLGVLQVAVVVFLTASNARKQNGGVRAEIIPGLTEYLSHQNLIPG